MFEHPISFKQVGEYLVFTCPDLVVTYAIEVPKTQAELLAGILHMLAKVKKRKSNFSDTNTKAPNASRIELATPKKELEKDFTPRTASRVLKVSYRTLIRHADKGWLRGRKTPGGQWRFNAGDITQYQNLLQSLASLPKNEDWLTPRACAELWKVSVNTARNWIDSGKIWSKKTKGGHRTVPRRMAIEFRN
jgi:excisionase family DNA binding protein